MVLQGRDAERPLQFSDSSGVGVRLPRADESVSGVAEEGILPVVQERRGEFMLSAKLGGAFLSAQESEDDLCLELGREGAVFLVGHACLSVRYRTVLRGANPQKRRWSNCPEKRPDYKNLFSGERIDARKGSIFSGECLFIWEESRLREVTFLLLPAMSRAICCLTTVVAGKSNACFKLSRGVVLIWSVHALDVIPICPT